MKGWSPLKYFKMKWLDIVLIVILVLVSFIPNAVFAYQALNKPVTALEKYLVIKVDATEIERIKLTADTPIYEHTILTGADKSQSNTITIDGDVVKMIDANCQDLVCVKAFPAISLNGEQIICLPHKLVVEIEGGEKPQGDLNAF